MAADVWRDVHILYLLISATCHRKAPPYSILNGMRRDTARISYIRIVAEGAPVFSDLSRFLSTLVGSGLEPLLPSERGGPVLGKEPFVRVLALFLANNVGLQLGWKLAGKISSVAENGARL
jgi:hypothetical protein